MKLSNTTISKLILSATVLIVAAACESDGGTSNPTDPGTQEEGGSEDSDVGAVDGMLVYGNPVEGGNTFACATCHALQEPALDGFRRPGHQIGDATRRPTFKNGELTDMREAVNTCLTEWMAAEPWEQDDPDWIALFEFLDEQAPDGEAPALEFEIVDAPDDLSGGDPAAGQALFNDSCAVCHGQDAIGTDRAPILAGVGLPEALVGIRVRTSGAPNSSAYEGLTGGRMPFWAADRLSDDELRDVAAYITTSDVPDPEDLLVNDGEGPSTGEAGTCGATHPRVGETAQLEAFSHGIAGTATIVDDCTIELSNFDFDGAGIDVRAWVYTKGEIDSGYSVSGNLVNFPTGYEGDVLTFDVGDLSLDDIDGLSIWCVPIGVSFGEGLFQ